MFDKIKLLGADTAIYGVSTVVGRLLTFLLTPFYTHLLARAELGVVANVYAWIAFFNIVFGCGMEAAYMRYVSSLEIGTKKQNFSVPFLSHVATSLLFLILILTQAAPLAATANVPLEHSTIIKYAGWILFLDALAIIPFASLRMERKAKLFAGLKLLNIITTVGCNLFFLLKMRWGIEGVFISNLIASAVTLAFLVPTILRNLDFDWSPALYKALLKFSLPTVPAALGGIMIQVINRPILRSLTDDATVGLFQANYRLGIFMMLLVSTFDFAWRPFFLSNAKEPNAKQLFARVLTYFFLLMMTCFIIISIFIGDIVTTPIFFGKSLIAENYWSGLGIVPVILLAYVFMGVSSNLVAGIYIEKQTKKLPLATFIGAAVSILVNLALIPSMGIMGAAIATLLSYAAMAVAIYFIGRKVYPIEYEWGRLGKIALSSAIVYACFTFIHPPMFELAWKVGLVVLFGVMMYVMKFFNASEVASMMRLFSKQRAILTNEEIPPSSET
jgi:O-antigen/teichoic acid export membrane protein